MNFEVPQFIETEDKIAFQLTAKQLGWFALGGFFMFLAWNFGSQGAFLVWAVFILLFSMAFAFVRPYGLSLAAFIGHGFLYFIRPRQMIWKREIVKRQEESKKEPKQEVVDKMIDEKETEKLAEILDMKKFGKM